MGIRPGGFGSQFQADYIRRWLPILHWCMAALVDALKKEVASLKEELLARSGAAAPDAPTGSVAEGQLEAVRAELVALRRRMNLKAKPSSATIDDAQLGDLADLVAWRLSRLFELDIDNPG